MLQLLPSSACLLACFGRTNRQEDNYNEIVRMMYYSVGRSRQRALEEDNRLEAILFLVTQPFSWILVSSETCFKKTNFDDLRFSKVITAFVKTTLLPRSEGTRPDCLTADSSTIDCHICHASRILFFLTVIVIIFHHWTKIGRTGALVALPSGIKN